MRLLTGLVAIVAIGCGAVLASCGEELDPGTSDEPTNQTTVPALTTTSTTIPVTDIEEEVRAFLVQALAADAGTYVDERLAEAGTEADYEVIIQFDAFPIGRLEGATQADRDAINALGAASVDPANELISGILGKGRPVGAHVSGDEDSARLELSPLLIDHGYLEGFADLTVSWGFPQSTHTTMQQTEPGTSHTAEHAGIRIHWTNDPEDGYAIDIRRASP